MNNRQFSDEFDTLLNSYSTPFTINLTEYEKSVFLTLAQKQIIKEYYTGKNLFTDSFERLEQIRRYLNELVETYKTTDKIADLQGVNEDSVFFHIPEDTWFITYESVILRDDELGCMDGVNSLVVPTTQDEYYKTNRNPFKGPNEHRVLRLDIKDNTVELVSKYNIESYLIRYVAKPTPIVLIDLPDNLNIDGVTEETERQLNSVLHDTILSRAVQIALQTKTLYNSKNNE